ncbi:hypothetical protein LSH36_37g02019 [Paralvinella palmiformis]|uniref:Uncharacterized protein n=1 Tax=Paralvinella palmiformis TaxID=53620 RepID=A0AAD9NFE8_9ANNE|nr:hypothetical protein LSH36_37g02019 [Paralvinella palmiformis]
MDPEYTSVGNESVCSCDPDDGLPTPPTSDFIQTAILTVLVIVGFVMTKSAYDEVRQIISRVTLVIIGAGPVGLLSLIAAARCGHVSDIVLYEEKSRTELFANNFQIALDPDSVSFLKSLAIDFDNIEGCWEKGTFYTRTGVFLEYLMSSVPKFNIRIDLRLKTKFTKQSLKDLELIFGRLVVIVCDGANGKASSLLGLSDEFTQHSCRSYGAVAILERHDQRSVPAPEVRVHNLNFQFGNYHQDCYRDPVPQAFHLKIFGSLRHRCLALLAPRSESKTLKALKVLLDHSVMRNIFLVCYNKYKSDCETDIDDTDGVKWLKFSPRMFEVKLANRRESVAYVEDANIFVITEGDTARRLNFHTGLDVNLGIDGLTSLAKFLQMAASADTERAILQALNYKHEHSKQLSQHFINNGLNAAMYT